jgi:RecA/RadA recombinase
MAQNSLMSKMLKKFGKDDKVNVLSSSTFFDKDIVIHSSVYLINLMMSGRLYGPEAGVRPGLTVVVGDSRTFKTNFCLSQMKDFLDQHPNGIALFADCEFGAKSSFEAFGIDKDRVIHIALENIEDMKFKIVQAIDEIAPGDEVFIFIDSVSQIASKKEIEDALKENSAADMTRAKQLNSFFRMITPSLMIKKIPCLVINSYYDDVSNQYAEKIIKGGKQIFLSADTILLVTRSQEKDDATKELLGWSFNYNMLKSRYVKEKSKFSLTVMYDGGIDRYSGLFELAMEADLIYSEKQAYYKVKENGAGLDTNRSFRKKELASLTQFWEWLVKDEYFNQFVHEKYALADGEMFKQEFAVDPDSGEILDAVA